MPNKILTCGNIALKGSFESYSIDTFLYLDLEMFLLTRNLFKVDLKEMRFAQI